MVLSLALGITDNILAADDDPGHCPLDKQITQVFVDTTASSIRGFTRQFKLDIGDDIFGVSSPTFDFLGEINPRTMQPRISHCTTTKTTKQTIWALLVFQQATVFRDHTCVLERCKYIATLAREQHMPNGLTSWLSLDTEGINRLIHGMIREIDALFINRVVSVPTLQMLVNITNDTTGKVRELHHVCASHLTELETQLSRHLSTNTPYAPGALKRSQHRGL